MTRARTRSGKGHRDENFPVASFLIAPAPSRGDPRLLPFRARRRRRRRPSPPRRPRSSPCSKTCAPAWPAKATPRPRAWPCARRWRAELSPAHGARSARGIPARRDQAALCRLGRSDGLLPLFGDAGGTLRARCPWRGPRLLARQRRALRRAPGDQSPAGLRQGLSRTRPRLSAARRAGRARARASRSSDDPLPRRLCAAIAAWRSGPRRCSRNRAALRRNQRPAPRLEVGGDPAPGRGPRRAADDPRSAVRTRPSSAGDGGPAAALLARFAGCPGPPRRVRRES